MKNVLFTLANLEGLSGSVIYVAEVTEYLLSKGYRVSLCCINSDLVFESLFTEKGINVFSSDNIDLHIKYDYVFAFHFPVLSLLLLKGLKYKKIIRYSHQSKWWYRYVKRFI